MISLRNLGEIIEKSCLKIFNNEHKNGQPVET